MDSDPQVQTEVVEMPLLPLRDVVVFPHMVIPLFVGREKSIKALESAMAGSKSVLLITQKDPNMDEPGIEDVYRYGTMASILQLLKLPDGTVKVLVEGSERGRVVETIQDTPFFLAKVQAELTVSMDAREAEVLVRTVLSQFEQYVKLNKKVPAEILTSLSGIEEPGRLVDTITAHISLKIEDKQKILEMSQLRERIDFLMQLMENEIDLLQVERRIHSSVKRNMEKSQREYYLNEQLKAIKKELGDLENIPDEFEDLKKKIDEAGMPKEAKEKAMAELKKLQAMSPMSAEATGLRNYIDWMVQIPWKKTSKINRDIKKADEILNADHYGLEKVKERILEYLAVQSRVQKLKGPILCLVGPPGVGKTSLGQSIARATGRKFVRMSLGGVRDEAEIRGHRRTYVGSLPGRILQKMAKVGVKNPLFLLDEIDKMAMDFRGDPASALLEVLDPEQNNTFNDHYIEVDYDLSDVMFVATANTLHIPEALLDRMEVINLSGYTEDEKLNIANRYLIPKEIKQNGLKEDELKITDDATLGIVRTYTRESGVRSLEREISKICRKAVKELSLNSEQKSFAVTQDELEYFLGVARYRYGLAEEKDRIGQVTGLAWTEVGGEILTIEAVAVPGKGKAERTGHLGEVMQESIQAAMTVVRSRAKMLGIDPDFHEKHDVHIHVPEGATPKDGPSAGVAMCVALVSALTHIPVRADVAMTGEITLRGEVLPIGGLKEKLLAARRAGIKHVLIPHENKRDLKEIPDNVKNALDIIPVRWIEEALKVALARMPEPKQEEKPELSVSTPPASTDADMRFKH